MKINKLKFKKMIFSFLVSILIEIFICNFPAFRTLICGNKNVVSDYKIESNKIIINDIGYRVTSIKIIYKNALSDKITYKVNYVSSGSSNIINLNPKVILPNQKQFINFDTHSECDRIEIELETDSDIQIDSIVLNNININVIFYRVILIYIIVSVIELLNNSNFYTTEFIGDSKKQDIEIITKIIFVFAIIVVYTILEHNSQNLFIDKTQINYEDSLLMQTESFMNGKVELLVKPSEELKNMKNPYDFEKRNTENIPYLYDIAYYNGSYYNYFGIAPIITSILPFRVITGGYTHCYIFNLLYIFGIMISLYYFLKKLVLKYIKRISIVNFELGYMAVLFGANIFTLLRGAKYDIVITSGIMFLLISLNLAISLHNNEKNNIKLFFLGINLALMVLSKPTFIIYYILVLYFILNQISGMQVKEKIIDFVKICIPLGIFAIFQMIFNHKRFGNILEFGAKYQLTSFNMINCMYISIGKIIAGFLEYIFRIPIINPLNFPFVFINTNTSLVSINEVLYENRLYGLIGIPILWILLFKNSIIEKKSNLNSFIFISIICVCLEIIINTCFGGICEAYSIDFKLILCIISIIMLLKYIEDKDFKKNKLFTIVTLLTIIIMLPINLTTELNFLINLRNSTTVFLKNLFEFWA